MNTLAPFRAEIVSKKEEAKGILTFRFRIQDPELRRSFRFKPGQFNMIYAFGAGEVPISIVSDPAEQELLDHTIRVVGHVTQALARHKKGDWIGLRGPYGSWWPLEEMKGRDIVLVTGGLGCAPVVSVINYIARRRESYGWLKVLHGLKTPRDLLYRKRFEAWRRHPRTEVYLTVDHPDQDWKYSVGVVTNLFKRVRIVPETSAVLICGPEAMMRHAIRDLTAQGLSGDRIYLSLERNMKCAVGICGRCQYGPLFVCRDGPVFRYDRIRDWFSKREI